MKTSIVALALAGLLSAGPLLAEPVQTTPIELGTDAARHVVVQSAGADVADKDPRIASARAWLKKAAQASGESEELVAATSVKLARYIHDTTRVRATPLEALEALATWTPAGKPLSDTTNAYFQARRAAPKHSHAEAMAALAGRK